MTSIGKTVRRLRQQSGLSQGRLAKRAKVSLNTVVKLEIGESTNPTIDTLQCIAQALNVSVHKLIP